MLSRRGPADGRVTLLERVWPMQHSLRCRPHVRMPECLSAGQDGCGVAGLPERCSQVVASSHGGGRRVVAREIVWPLRPCAGSLWGVARVCVWMDADAPAPVPTTPR